MPQTKTILIYKFDELTDKAKEVARNWFRSVNTSDQFEWDSTKQDAADIGLQLSEESHRKLEGNFLVSAKDCADEIMANHGAECETYKTAQKFLKDVENLKTDAYVKEEHGERLDELESEFLGDILEAYHVILLKELEFRQSDEYIDEAISANEYEFLESGKKF